VHRDARLSKLPDADLLRGWTWARGQAWLDEPTSQLLAQAIGKISAGPKGAQP
jgi:hypothetical protein